MRSTVFIGLQTRNLGARTRQLTNPFTGEKIVTHIDDGMTEEESRAALAILSVAGASEPDPERFRKVTFRDGNSANIRLGKVRAEIELTGGVTAEAVKFVFRLGLASGMLITSTIDPDCVAVLPGQRHPGITDRWPAATDLHSASELMDWIVGRIEKG